MSILAQRPFGIADGKPATEYTLQNIHGAQLSVTDMKRELNISVQLAADAQTVSPMQHSP